MNNQLRLGVLIAGLALAAGAGLGLVVPGTEASGPVTTSIYYYAGVDYGTSVLTCGWHSDCEGTPNYERA
ncbi:MAG TPA: hypothetical protein VJQ83_00390, partial [Tepidiformaceae bacterium]|nr:hypothetical protein [Tepidiformaceae bacterium]